MGVFYTTRESVKLALDAKETARADWQIDDAIDAASRAIENCTRRVFYPWTGTRYFDWPDPQLGTSYRLWLEENELISVSALTSGGTAISPATYNLEPANQGPPFELLELKLSTSATFGLSDSHQRDVAITGVFGYRDDSSSAGALAAAVLDTTGTSISLTVPVTVGVGSVIRIDTERMIVTAKTMADSGQTLQTPLAAQANNQTVAVTDGTVFRAGEVILLDAERVRIDDIAGNNLIVTRSWDGSTLAAHTGSAIYRLTTATVERGALGTTAATHLISAPVARWNPPAQIRQLARAQAIDTVLQEQSGYARTVGSGDNTRGASGASLGKLWAQVEEDFRRVRLGVV